jgi:hypothetical protein
MFPFNNRVFGFHVGRKTDDKEKQLNRKSFALPNVDDGAVVIETGTGAPAGAWGTGLSFDQSITSEIDLINKYRDMATQSDIDLAVADIVDESIVTDSFGPPVSVNTDLVPFSDNIKEKIQKEFQEILKIMNFRKSGFDIFRKWYVDGKLYYHIILDKDNVSDGIVELRHIDPRFIRKIQEIERQRDPVTGTDIVSNTKEYYVYNPMGIIASGTLVTSSAVTMATGIKVEVDSIAYSHSGLLEPNTNIVLSHLHKAIKPFNQLRMVEDAMVIYRITRAPERLVFYIDTGNLPKNKSEAYVESIMTKYKNKVVYDANTGEIRDDRRFSTITENYWLPRREGGKGTEIGTIPGGQNLGEMEDVEYFRKKLYKALNIPVSRLEQDKSWNLGRSTEISRDEVKFSKFINRLRTRFSSLFDQLLRIQLIAKGIVSESDWINYIENNITYDFQSDSHFAELKELEVLSNRIDLVDKMSQYVGKYFTDKYIRKQILRQDDKDIAEMENDLASKKETSEQNPSADSMETGLEGSPELDDMESSPMDPETPEELPTGEEEEGND